MRISRVRRGWRVALELPHETRFTLLEHAALATSGDLARGGDVDGRPRSHVIDPRTGEALAARPRRASALAFRGAIPPSEAMPWRRWCRIHDRTS